MMYAVFTVLALIIISTNGLDNIHERCTISEGGGVTVDSCDGSKFISCQNGRCTCNDAANQIFTYRIEKEKRQKRGLGKKVAIGAGGAFVGYEVAKATSGGGGIGHSSSDRESSSKKKVYACYGRIGAPCALDYNNVVVKIADNSTIMEHSQNETNHDASSSTTAAPVVIDLQKLSKCVYHAICKPRGDNSTTIKSNDPRVGVCTCDIGYKRTSQDICESKAHIITSPTSFGIIALLVLSCKMIF